MKICGLTDAGRSSGGRWPRPGARYIGFNFFPKSPRYVTPAEARDLALMLDVPVGVAKVALTL